MYTLKEVVLMLGFAAAVGLAGDRVLRWLDRRSRAAAKQEQDDTGMWIG